MLTETLNFNEVRAAIDAKAWRTSFPSTIEAAYENHRRRYKARDIRSTIVPCVTVYNLFLLLDYLLVPETFALAVAVHLGLVTPYMIWAASVLKREPRKVVRELVTISVPCLMVAQILLIYALNTGEGADQYQYLTVVVVIFMGSVQRADARYAIVASLAMMALYIAVLSTGSSPPAVEIVGVTLMGSVAYLTATANRRVEQSARHAFLRTLQDRFDRIHALEAARRDPLTGLGNRRHLDEHLAQNWPAMAASGTSVAVLVVDVDHFKVLNDTLGHDAGDMCLRRIGDLFSATIRLEDMVVRYGGEEFVVVLLHATATNAVKAADRLRESVQALGLSAGGDTPGNVVTVSVGVCTGTAAETSLPSLITDADKALYQAKRSGRNRVVLHNG